MQAAQDRQKSYADRKRKPMEFEIGDRVMLKVSPWKGVVNEFECYSDEPLVMSVERSSHRYTLQLMEEPVEIPGNGKYQTINEADNHRLKVRWNLKAGP
ncbi:hypothetical protein Tco_0728963 [Tanacetum coccineum]|uniref:Reverse transcriptase domain-containing protein n=1 Tax=Tanacetum coccineum TaxID=301880 RepID=A0ABQ4YNG3_9ASTR